MMLGLGSNLMMSNPVLGPSFSYDGGMDNWTLSYSVAESGVNTGITSSYFIFGGWLDLSDHANTVATNADTGMTVDVTYKNIKRGTSYTSSSETVYGEGDTSFKIALDQSKWEGAEYDDVRSASSGSDVEILPEGFTASVSQSDNTAIDLSFTGSYSNSFEITLTLYGVDGAEITTSSEYGAFSGNFDDGINSFDLVFPVRAENSTGSPVVTESYASITLTNATVPATVTMLDVPIWIDSNDTFNIRDKNGNLIDITSNFVYTDSSGTDQTVDLTDLDGAPDFISVTFNQPYEESNPNSAALRNTSISVLIS